MSRSAMRQQAAACELMIGQDKTCPELLSWALILQLVELLSQTESPGGVTSVNIRNAQVSTREK